MANPLKQLAGDTAIYGLSTILARIINFLFVPFYTRLLTTESYGVVTEFMAYIAVLQVILVLGLETGCFRFANKEGVNPDSVYSNALVAVFGVSGAFFAAMSSIMGRRSSSGICCGCSGCGSTRSLMIKPWCSKTAIYSVSVRWYFTTFSPKKMA